MRGLRRDVIPDYRDPGGLRLGLSPLSTSFAEVSAGVDAVREARDSRASLVIDLSSLDYMSSRGLRALTLAKREAQKSANRRQESGLAPHAARKGLGRHRKEKALASKLDQLRAPRRLIADGRPPARTAPLDDDAP